VSTGNLAGDAQADLSVDGRPDKAVYAYPSEHLVTWTSEFGEPPGHAAFGENLSIRGAIEADAGIRDVAQQVPWSAPVRPRDAPRWPATMTRVG
jgi:MOSC domain-containing protein YiiM